MPTVEKSVLAGARRCEVHRYFKVALALVIVVAVACATPTLTPESTNIHPPTATPKSTPVQVSSDAATAAPANTPESPAGETPSPTPTITQMSGEGTTVPSPTTPASAIIVPQLVIAAIPSNLPPYDREDWKHWSDVDDDCQNTRMEVLALESLIPVTLRDDRQCTVISGQWLDLYTGVMVEVPGDLDVDHLVPLANAHRSGGWAWTAQQKEEYANALSFDDHLIAVTASANRSKGDKGPEEWQPPDESYRCEYAVDWIRVKAAWGLTATLDEWVALEEMLSTCSFKVIMEAGGTPLPTQPITPTVEHGVIPLVVNTVSAGAMFITEIMPNPSAVNDAAGEWLEIYNPVPEVSIDINGWTLRDQGTDFHVIDNGGPLLVPPQGFLVLGRNSDPLTNAGVSVDYQYSGFVLGNADDEIQLIDSAGTVVDILVYEGPWVFDGSSSSLGPAAFDANENDEASNWCPSTSLLPSGDRGTPGSVNGPCR